MLSLLILFWLMVFLFSLSGSLRGWHRELIATSGIILALFAINQFGFQLLNLFGWTTAGLGEATAARRSFYLFAGTLIIITFFSYQGPTLSSAIGARLRIEKSLGNKMLGFVIGAINGYLVIGGIWAFLEYFTTGMAAWIQYSPGVPYPFPPEIITRPGVDQAAANIIANLPIPFLSPYLPYLMIVIFLFVLIAMI